MSCLQSYILGRKAVGVSFQMTSVRPNALCFDALRGAAFHGSWVPAHGRCGIRHSRAIAVLPENSLPTGSANSLTFDWRFAQTVDECLIDKK